MIRVDSNYIGRDGRPTPARENAAIYPTYESTLETVQLLGTFGDKAWSIYYTHRVLEVKPGTYLARGGFDTTTDLRDASLCWNYHEDAILAQAAARAVGIFVTIRTITRTGEVV